MVLHELCNSINRNGYRCGIIFINGGNAVEQNFQFAISNDPSFYMPNSNYYAHSSIAELKEIIETGVVIYPDLINGNPLGAFNVVRYILNFNDNPFIGDYVLSFSNVYSKFANKVLFKSFKNSAFNDSGTMPWHARTLNLTYFGKGPSFIECKLIENSILLERDWPRDKNQLALLLKQTKFLFTYDCVSATLQDALMCGAVPVLLHDRQIPRNIINKMEIGPYPEIFFNSIEDLPNGMNYDISSVNLSINNFQNLYNILSEDWDKNVNNFIQSYLYESNDK